MNLFYPGAAALARRLKRGVPQTTQTIALADSGTVNGGANLTYTTTYTNTGAITANTVSVVVTLDAKLTFVSAIGTGWSCSAVGQAVTCTRASAAAGAAPTISIVATAANDGTTSVSTTAQATASNAPTANASNDTTTVVPQTTMTLSTTASANPVITGADAFTYAVVATNTGSNTGTSLSVAVTLDASLTYVSASGTGWTCNQSGGVVTCTRATLAVGAAPTITISVTTGTSAVTAATNGALTGTNFPTANGNSSITVQLVSKDATSGIYFPASATEWTNFVARKGLGIANPASLWLCQEASGNLADSIGSRPLTVSGATPAYAQAVSGFSRGAFQTADGGSVIATAAWPTTATASAMLLAFVKVNGTPAAAHSLGGFGTVAQILEVLASGALRVAAANTATGTTSMITMGATPLAMRYVVGTTQTTGFNLNDKVVPTVGSRTSVNVLLGDVGVVNAPCQYMYACAFTGAAAELSDATLKSLLQALGWSPTWS